MRLINKFAYSQNWNIGFCEQTPEELIHDQKLKHIQWMKHSYRDRWFADPFILKVTENEIIIFVEECLIEKPKGIICELIVDRRSKRLKQRYVLLELDTHLSYPAIIQNEGKIFVYPENGNSGELNIYEYDGENHRLKNPICILKEPVADATILYKENKWYIAATKYPKTQENVFLYSAKTIYGPFMGISNQPFQSNKLCSRPGGNWFYVNGQLYRPSQNCVRRYGSGLSIMKSTIFNNSIDEQLVINIIPSCHSFSKGLHTINFQQGLCVVDGCGYLYPYIGPIIHFLKRIKRYLVFKI